MKEKNSKKIKEYGIYIAIVIIVSVSIIQTVKCMKLNDRNKELKSINLENEYKLNNQFAELLSNSLCSHKLDSKKSENYYSLARIDFLVNMTQNITFENRDELRQMLEKLSGVYTYLNEKNESLVSEDDYEIMSLIPRVGNTLSNGAYVMYIKDGEPDYETCNDNIEEINKICDKYLDDYE